MLVVEANRAVLDPPPRRLPSTALYVCAILLGVQDPLAFSVSPPTSRSRRGVGGQAMDWLGWNEGALGPRERGCRADELALCAIADGPGRIGSNSSGPDLSAGTWQVYSAWASYIEGRR